MFCVVGLRTLRGRSCRTNAKEKRMHHPTPRGSAPPSRGYLLVYHSVDPTYQCILAYLRYASGCGSYAVSFSLKSCLHTVRRGVASCGVYHTTSPHAAPRTRTPHHAVPHASRARTFTPATPLPHQHTCTCPTPHAPFPTPPLPTAHYRYYHAAFV